MSLDGFVAGPNVSTEQPMGEGQRSASRTGCSPARAMRRPSGSSATTSYPGAV